MAQITLYIDDATQARLRAAALSRQVLAPMRVDGLQHHHAHERRELLAADDVELAREDGIVSSGHLLDDLVVGDAVAGVDFALGVDGQLPFALERALQAGHVPPALQAAQRHTVRTSSEASPSLRSIEGDAW